MNKTYHLALLLIFFIFFFKWLVAFHESGNELSLVYSTRDQLKILVLDNVCFTSLNIVSLPSWNPPNLPKQHPYYISPSFLSPPITFPQVKSPSLCRIISPLARIKTFLQSSKEVIDWLKIDIFSTLHLLAKMHLT